MRLFMFSDGSRTGHVYCCFTGNSVGKSRAWLTEKTTFLLSGISTPFLTGNCWLNHPAAIGQSVWAKARLKSRMWNMGAVPRQRDGYIVAQYQRVSSGNNPNHQHGAGVGSSVATAFVLFV